MAYKSIVFGALESNYVAIKIFGYEAPKEPETKDANWLCAEIGVSAGTWGGRVRNAYLTCAELARFREELEDLVAGKSKEAQFEPMEPHLILKVSTETSGRVQVSGVAFDQPDGGNALAFNWLMDPKQLKNVIKQINEIGSDFPPR